MLNLRRPMSTRASRLVVLSLGSSFIGRFAFDSGDWRDMLMTMGSVLLVAGMIFLVFDMRDGNNGCEIGR